MKKNDLRSMAQEQNQPANKEYAQKVLDSYKDKSQEQLMQELLAAANAQKANGNFSEQSLKLFQQKAAGILNEEQSKRMAELIDKITK